MTQFVAYLLVTLLLHIQQRVDSCWTFVSFWDDKWMIHGGFVPSWLMQRRKMIFCGLFSRHLCVIFFRGSRRWWYLNLFHVTVLRHKQAYIHTHTETGSKRAKNELMLSEMKKLWGIYSAAGFMHISRACLTWFGKYKREKKKCRKQHLHFLY